MTMDKQTQPTQPARQLDAITTLMVEGYKSIRDPIGIDIKPITILAGTNSSGKSSIMQPLLLLKQTLEAPYDPGPLELTGPNVIFNDSVDMFFCTPAHTSSMRFTVGIGKEMLTFEFRRGSQAIELAAMYYTKEGDPGSNCAFFPQMRDSVIQKMLPRILKDATKHLDEQSWSVARNRCFLVYDLKWKHKTTSQIRAITATPADTFALPIRSSIHVPGIRGNAERRYKRIAGSSHFSGTFPQHIAYILYQWKQSNSPKLASLGSVLENMGLTWTVEPRGVNETTLELLVGRTRTKRRKEQHDLVSIADVGFGVSQVLPVLIALLVAQRNQLVYIEQPELHLHPRAQELLAEPIVEAASRGAHVIIETHSSSLILAIQAAVAEGRFDAKNVALNWFSLSSTGVTRRKAGRLSKAGTLGDWPADFDKTNLELQSRFINAAAKHR